MKEKSLKVIYMGTPEFAVSPLDEIYNSRHEILAVVTTADKPSGRGLKLNESAVKLYAKEKNIPILQPNRLKDPYFISNLKQLNADIFVVVAFKILPKEVWSIPKFGTFNLHSSLLPKYRGASPINYAIINGEKETGVTTFFIDENIDTGKILKNAKIAIEKEDTFGSLHDKLKTLGSTIVLETINSLSEGNLIPYEQPIDPKQSYQYAPKIFKEDCKINWEKPTEQIYNFIRGLSPFPTAHTTININNEHKSLKIFNGNFFLEKHNLEIGKIIIEKKTLKISTPDGFYLPIELQLEGKKKVNIVDFINGIPSKENIFVK